MLTWRTFFRTAADTAFGAAGGCSSLHSAVSKIGVRLGISDIVAFVLRDPAEKKREDQFVSMTSLGATTGGIGLWDRLERAETVRWEGRQAPVVKVTTNQGIVGWGESHAVLMPCTVKTVLPDLFRPILLGLDARQIEPVREQMYSSQRLRGSGTEYFTRAMAGVDIALQDIVGRAAEMPV